MMPAGNRSSLRLPAGIFVSARSFLVPFAVALCALASAAQARDDMNATIRGHARFSGPVPPRPRITMTIDPACDALNPQGRPSDTVVVDGTGGLANVIVHVKQGLDSDLTFAPPTSSLTIDLKGCTFEPHVAALRVGQEVLLRNHY